jgi:dihydroflavonol-4-reductase
MAQNRRLAITGATGHVGQQILQHLLDEGYTDIRCLYRKEKPGSSDPRIQWIQGDLLDVFSLDDLVSGADTLIHAAGLVSFSPLDKARLFKVNAEGTGNLVNVALNAGVRHLIHVSSTAALGRPATTERITEQVEWVKSPWNTPYGESQYNAELEVWRGMEEGLGVTIINPALILDPHGQSRSTRVFLKWLKEGNSFFPAGGNGFVDIRDVARFVGECIKKEPTGERVILAGANLSYQEILSQLASLCQLKAPTRLLSRRMAHVFALGKYLIGRSGLFPQEVMLAYLKVHYDSSRSIQKYGFSYMPLATTLADIAARKQGK